MQYFILLLSLFGIMIACRNVTSDVFPKETIMRVNHYRQSCQGEGKFNCLLVQEDSQLGTDSWNLFYGDIQGFQYEEGYVYTLNVKIEKILNPPMDGSDRKYVLVEVLSKEKVK